MNEIAKLRKRVRSLEAQLVDAKKQVRLSRSECNRLFRIHYSLRDLITAFDRLRAEFLGEK